jgi:pimeloyl-ACP methyl ester carboxylesterase
MQAAERDPATTTRFPRSGPPARFWRVVELRALAELVALPYALPLLLQAPRGDGHPVLLLPGFMSSERPLFALKAYLANRGYAVETWGLGRNVGFQRKHAAALEQKLRYMHHRTGRKVSLVGWSLGGTFSMYVTHQVPECVRSVITLGSPVSSDPEGSNTAPMVKALYRMIAHPLGTVAHTTQPRARRLRSAPPVPVSCLYSLGDGVVPPQEATIDGDARRHENIRVPGSHLGLGFNPVVLWIVADRLSQPEGEWRPFAPRGAAGRAYRLLTRFAATA